MSTAVPVTDLLVKEPTQANELDASSLPLGSLTKSSGRGGKAGGTRRGRGVSLTDARRLAEIAADVGEFQGPPRGSQELEEFERATLKLQCGDLQEPSDEGRLRQELAMELADMAEKDLRPQQAPLDGFQGEKEEGESCGKQKTSQTEAATCGSHSKDSDGDDGEETDDVSAGLQEDGDPAPRPSVSPGVAAFARGSTGSGQPFCPDGWSWTIPTSAQQVSGHWTDVHYKNDSTGLIFNKRAQLAQYFAAEEGLSISKSQEKVSFEFPRIRALDSGSLREVRRRRRGSLAEVPRNGAGKQRDFLQRINPYAPHIGVVGDSPGDGRLGISPSPSGYKNSPDPDEDSHQTKRPRMTLLNTLQLQAEPGSQARQCIEPRQEPGPPHVEVELSEGSAQHLQQYGEPPMTPTSSSILRHKEHKWASKDQQQAMLNQHEKPPLLISRQGRGHSGDKGILQLEPEVLDFFCSKRHAWPETSKQLLGSYFRCVTAIRSRHPDRLEVHRAALAKHKMTGGEMEEWPLELLQVLGVVLSVRQRIRHLEKKELVRAILTSSVWFEPSRKSRGQAWPDSGNNAVAVEKGRQGLRLPPEPTEHHGEAFSASPLPNAASRSKKPSGLSSEAMKDMKEKGDTGEVSQDAAHATSAAEALWSRALEAQRTGKPLLLSETVKAAGPGDLGVPPPSESLHDDGMASAKATGTTNPCDEYRQASGNRREDGAADASNLRQGDHGRQALQTADQQIGAENHSEEKELEDSEVRVWNGDGGEDEDEDGDGDEVEEEGYVVPFISAKSLGGECEAGDGGASQGQQSGGRKGRQGRKSRISGLRHLQQEAHGKRRSSNAPAFQRRLVQAPYQRMPQHSQHLPFPWTARPPYTQQAHPSAQRQVWNSLAGGALHNGPEVQRLEHDWQRYGYRKVGSVDQGLGFRGGNASQVWRNKAPAAEHAIAQRASGQPLPLLRLPSHASPTFRGASSMYHRFFAGKSVHHLVHPGSALVRDTANHSAAVEVFHVAVKSEEEMKHLLAKAAALASTETSPGAASNHSIQAEVEVAVQLGHRVLDADCTRLTKSAEPELQVPALLYHAGDFSRPAQSSTDLEDQAPGVPKADQPAPGKQHESEGTGPSHPQIQQQGQVQHPAAALLRVRPAVGLSFVSQRSAPGTTQQLAKLLAPSAGQPASPLMQLPQPLRAPAVPPISQDATTLSRGSIAPPITAQPGPDVSSSLQGEAGNEAKEGDGMIESLPAGADGKQGSGPSESSLIVSAVPITGCDGGGQGRVAEDGTILEGISNLQKNLQVSNRSGVDGHKLMTSVLSMHPSQTSVECDMLSLAALSCHIEFQRQEARGATGGSLERTEVEVSYEQPGKDTLVEVPVLSATHQKRLVRMDSCESGDEVDEEAVEAELEKAGKCVRDVEERGLQLVEEKMGTLATGGRELDIALSAVREAEEVLMKARRRAREVETRLQRESQAHQALVRLDADIRKEARECLQELRRHTLLDHRLKRSLVVSAEPGSSHTSTTVGPPVARRMQLLESCTASYKRYIQHWEMLQRLCHVDLEKDVKGASGGEDPPEDEEDDEEGTDSENTS